MSYGSTPGGIDAARGLSYLTLMEPELKFLLLYAAGINLVTFVFFGFDKHRAVSGGWRTPEKTLWLLALVGGFLGGFAAMRVFKHKRRKRAFMVPYWIATLASVGLIVWGIVTFA